MDKYDWYIMIIASVVMLVFVIYMQWKLWAIVVAVIILLFLYWILQSMDEIAYDKGDKRIIGTYVGYMVTWMTQFSTYENVRGENAMRVVYGRADIYNDGYYESIPESFRMTYRMGATDIQLRFNPYYDMHMLDDLARKQGKRVPFADGTEQYLNLNVMGVRNQYKQAPKNLTRIPRTYSG